MAVQCGVVKKMRFTFGVDLTRHVVTVLKNVLVEQAGG